MHPFVYVLRKIVGKSRAAGTALIAAADTATIMASTVPYNLYRHQFFCPSLQVFVHKACTAQEQSHCKQMANERGQFASVIKKIFLSSCWRSAFAKIEKVKMR